MGASHGDLQATTKLSERVPTSKPPFEYNDLKKAIPPHCFGKKLFRSLYAISIEILIVFTLYYVASNYFHILPRFVSCIVWPVYWIFQGFSHANHHSHTNSLESDEAHIPKRKSHRLYNEVMNNPIGAAWAFYVYGGPWIFMCVIVTIITYLQHNHPSIPHYDSTEWNWIRGALSTIDRDIGFTIVKNKTDNHVVHHLFPSIPRYHAHEATEAIKPILGDYYKYDGTPIIQAFWREMKECIYVESDNDKQKNKNGVYWFRK
nr:fatty acid desaturase, type 1 [Tanacetum cinerariifolium]